MAEDNAILPKVVATPWQLSDYDELALGCHPHFVLAY